MTAELITPVGVLVMSAEDLARFWAKVSRGRATECWPWARGVNAYGYGVLTFRQRRYLAHRMSYLIAHARIPDGAVIRHQCDNPPCVNPAHLLAGTHADNVRDRIERGRTNQVRGEGVSTARITESQVRQIRRMAASGDISGRAIGRRLGIGRGTVRSVLSGRTWVHVGGMS